MFRIENYSRHLSGKVEGEAPETLLSYFPHSAMKNSFSQVLGSQVEPDHSKKKFSSLVPDFLTIIDESHVTLPQLGECMRVMLLVKDFS